VEAQVEPEALFALVERGRRLGVAVRFWNITEKYDTASVETLCPWPFERAYVASDLRIVPCCMIANPDVAEIGSGRSTGRPMSDTWFGAEYKAFRQAHLDGRVPDFCAGCYRNGGAHRKTEAGA
jgi:pyrroloquinoline quinone biosynthesis protein E